jgi:hypothetical protein
MRSPVTGGRKNDAADAEALWKPVTRRAREVDGASAGLHDDCPGAPGKREIAALERPQDLCGRNALRLCRFPSVRLL